MFFLIQSNIQFLQYLNFFQYEMLETQNAFFNIQLLKFKLFMCYMRSMSFMYILPYMDLFVKLIFSSSFVSTTMFTFFLNLFYGIFETNFVVYIFKIKDIYFCQTSCRYNCENIRGRFLFSFFLIFCFFFRFILCLFLFFQVLFFQRVLTRTQSAKYLIIFVMTQLEGTVMMKQVESVLENKQIINIKKYIILQQFQQLGFYMCKYIPLNI
eukprot:TRINITY_DN7952_c0_g1_i1.p1 TRINITY_DN7952_c0_g1~~TRINITY_DN7952_c0_g1_i1.p1  ORF type:complete len:232 (+),score=-21.08 TRINITY_DN7952_c0_g1_i1:66-698(+)